MLGLCWWRMLESGESLRYIIKHGDMDIFVHVVPVNIHSKIACAAPVLGAFVVFFRMPGRCSTCSRLTYLMPKSSTQSVKDIG
jgi:hypothetical protein